MNKNLIKEELLKEFSSTTPDAERRIERAISRALIQHNKVLFVSLKKSKKDKHDQDYLIIDDKAHFICNHDTLKYAMELHQNVTDQNEKKSYVMPNFFDQLEKGMDLNIL